MMRNLIYYEWFFPGLCTVTGLAVLSRPPVTTVEGDVGTGPVLTV